MKKILFISILAISCSKYRNCSPECQVQQMSSNGYVTIGTGNIDACTYYDYVMKSPTHTDANGNKIDAESLKIVCP